ncbi:hypothetical protein HOLleu_13713 [Holothuria leucospilota]|uniref:Uncharacterized protein n=1 Tax=Holothuria leucospilota TaxID=206669 RepID=A0A9Q1C5H8_HOLLE|nr:hypothetical protein HOLleu_13713 [Holothuria leucospilota]
MDNETEDWLEEKGVGDLINISEKALAKAIVQQCAGTRDTADGTEGHEHCYSNGHGFIEYRLKTICVGQPDVKKTTKRTAPSPDLHADNIEEDYERCRCLGKGGVDEAPGSKKGDHSYNS